MGSPYKHTDNLKELDEQVFILNGFDYTDKDPYGVAENFFQFCQQNLSEECEEYKIQPAKFYVRDVWTVNALAALRNGYYVIGMNIGTMTTMFKFFTEHGEIFKLDRLADFKAIDGKVDVPLEYLMFQLCVQWTYYHELTHLIQYSPLPDANPFEGEQLLLEEEEVYAINAGPQDLYSLEKHLKEFDADLNAANYITLQVISYWKRTPKAIRNDETLKLLLSLEVAGIFSYFLYLLTGYPEMYYKASDHPHPMVRILYIVDMILKTTKEQLEDEVSIDQRAILLTGFEVADTLFSLDGDNRVERFKNLLDIESANIESYVNEVLITESQTRPALIVNRNKPTH